jgi:hypothetical protein
MIVLIGLFAYQYGYKTVYSEITAIKENQSVKMNLLEKYDVLIAQKPDLEKKLKSLRDTRKAHDPSLVVGMTPPLAAARLQEAIRAAITQRGGTISSERVEKPEDQGAFKVIRVSIDAVIPDTQALSDILYSIETSTPTLIVKKLDIRNKVSRRSNVTNVSNDLVVKLTVASLTGGV